MTTYTLFSQANLGQSQDTDTAGHTICTQFSVSQSMSLTGIWWYSAAGSASLPTACAIFDSAGQAIVSGTQNLSPSWSGAVGSGWVRCNYDGSVTLVSGKQYFVAVQGGNGSSWYSDVLSYWSTGPGSSGITNGPLSAPNNASAIMGQCAFANATTLTYPTTTYQADNFSVDVEVTTIGGGSVTGQVAHVTVTAPVGTASAQAGVTVATTSIANVVQGVRVRRWLIASGGTGGPYTWAVTSGSLPSGLALASDGTLSGTPTATGTSAFTVQATDTASHVGSASFSVTCVSAPFSPSSPATDGNGVITWSITSAINGNNAESIRVLNPTSPGGYPHGFLFTLPTETGTDDTADGNGLDTVRTLGLHNTYNLTVIEASFASTPWYGDNPTAGTCLEETYMLQVVAWAASQYGTGGENNYLIGLSKSGSGGQGLFFHRPDLYYAVASWDFPAMMTTYDGTDSFHGTVGGTPAGVYGTQDNFAANYELSPGNLAKWSAGQNFGTVKRVWIGDFSAFQADVAAYDPVLTAAGILHTYSDVSQSAHNWSTTPGWVAPALAAIIPTSANVSGLSASVFVAAPLGTASASGPGTQLDARRTMTFNAYTSVTAQATMEFEAGQPFEEEVATLASDPWIAMYPG